MNIDIKMPDLATTADSVTLLRWLIAPGEFVKLGQPLLEIETDKATMEVESVAEGVLTAVFAQPGEVVPVGQVIATIAAGERVAVAPPVPEAVLPPDPPAPLAPMPVEAPPASAPPVPSPRMSLFARNRAKRQWALEAAAGPQPVPLTPAQAVTARRMQHAAQTIPTFHLALSANAEPMMAARAADSGIIWDAFFVRAVARASARFVRLRCRFDEDKLVPIPGDAVGVAVDFDDDLYVIPVERPHESSLREISSSIMQTVKRIRSGDTSARKLGTTYMTITNLGVTNIEAFLPIINPPEPAILGIGRVAAVPHVQDGNLIVQHRVNLTLTVDHRVASGRYASAFLQSVVNELEAIE